MHPLNKKYRYAYSKNEFTRVVEHGLECFKRNIDGVLGARQWVLGNRMIESCAKIDNYDLFELDKAIKYIGKISRKEAFDFLAKADHKEYGYKLWTD